MTILSEQNKNSSLDNILELPHPPQVNVTPICICRVVNLIRLRHERHQPLKYELREGQREQHHVKRKRQRKRVEQLEVQATRRDAPAEVFVHHGGVEVDGLVCG